MSRHRHESYRFLKTHYRFCEGTHLHQHKIKGGKGSLNPKKDGEWETGRPRKNRSNGLSGLNGAIQILTLCGGWTDQEEENQVNLR